MENQDTQNSNSIPALEQEYKESLLKSGIQAAKFLGEIIDLKIMPDPRAKEMSDVALELIKLINSSSDEIFDYYENDEERDNDNEF